MPLIPLPSQMNPPQIPISSINSPSADNGYQVNYKTLRFVDQLHLHHQGDVKSLCTQLLFIYPHRGLSRSCRRANESQRAESEIRRSNHQNPEKILLSFVALKTSIKICTFIDVIQVTNLMHTSFIL